MDIHLSDSKGFFVDEALKDQLLALRIVAFSAALQPYQKKFQKTPYVLQKFQMGLLCHLKHYHFPPFFEP